jgi:hypothetical protein
VPELSSGAFAELFATLATRVQVATPLALTPLALAVEREAKLNASNGEHARGTKTPASPGQGPARISGTLVRSITHSEPRPTGGGWEVKVGTAGGLYPPYSRHTASSRYGRYLETGLRNGSTYPFLHPALHKVVTDARELFARALSGF